MIGHMYLTFEAEAVGIDLAHCSKDDGAEDLDSFKRIGRQSPVIGDLIFANNLNAAKYVKRQSNEELTARHDLSIDPRNMELTVEERYRNVQIHIVQLHCWVTVRTEEMTVENPLMPGTWNNPRKDRGIIVEPDPSKDNARRMSIKIAAPSLKAARLLLHKVLGNKLILKPWAL